MNEQDKQLLLKDLCARLPYGVKIKTSRGIYIVDAVDSEGLFSIPNNDKTLNDLISLDGHYWLPITDDYKPYLRPMSSMTEEEKRDAAVLFLGGVPYKDKKGKWHTIVHDSSYGEIHTDFDLYNFANGYYGFENIDFLYSHHIDFRGLIPMGLAIEAPEGMYDN